MPEVIITEADLNLSADQVALKVFMPLTSSLYADGIEGAAKKSASTPEAQAKFKNDASLLKPFTKETHDSLGKPIPVLSILVAVFALGVVYFSAGWGRLANLGFLLLVASFFGTVLSFLMLKSPAGKQEGLGSWSPIITGHDGSSLDEVYTKVTLLGAAMLFAALIGKIVTKLRTEEVAQGHTHVVRPSKKD